MSWIHFFITVELAVLLYIVLNKPVGYWLRKQYCKIKYKSGDMYKFHWKELDTNYVIIQRVKGFEVFCKAVPGGAEFSVWDFNLAGAKKVPKEDEGIVLLAEL